MTARLGRSPTGVGRWTTRRPATTQRSRNFSPSLRAAEHWRCYLEGSPHPLILRSDHKSLTYLDTKQELSSRLYRWLMELAPYEWTVEYVPGEKNAAADALSRRVDLEEDVTAARPHERPLKRPRLRLKTQADQATVAARPPPPDPGGGHAWQRQ